MSAETGRPPPNPEHGRLYPPIEPFDKGRMAVGDGHELYWERCGNPDGVPVVFLHGGPGGGIAPIYRRFFDPEHYHIILFDQRGAGRSSPLAEVADNSTDHLIADMERLRERFGVARWLVFGGSWGCTLALAYGQAHPDRCLGFVLRGVFLFRAREVDWFLHGMGTLFPEARQAFLDFLPEAERDDPLAAYWARLADPDPGVHMPAAQAWYAYEASCSRLVPPADGRSNGVTAPPRQVLAMARIEAHFMRHRGFLAEGQLLDGLARVRHLPCEIVQGRYDAVCPIVTADEVRRAWPGCRYTVVPRAGHSALEPGIRDALVVAMDRMKDVSG